MTENRILELIENLASAVVMADPSDKPALGLMMSTFESLDKALPNSAGDVWQKSIKEASNLLTDIVLDAADDPDAALARVSDIVAKLQQLQHNLDAPEGESADSDSVADDSPVSPEEDDDSGDDGSQSVSSGAFELPDWVDETTFKEFLAGQPMVLDDIEGDLLEVEKGNREGTASFKRRVHTMKGEAGVIGLTDLADVCHAMEDFVDSSAPPSDKVDRLLHVKDWIASAIEAYSEMKTPAIPGAQIASELRDLIESAAKEKPASAQAKPAKKSKSTSKSKNAKTESEPESDVTSDTSAADATAVQADSPTSGSVEKTVVAGDVAHLERDDETVTMISDFLQESEEGLADVDNVLMSMEQSDYDPEDVNRLFRVFHTIKGVAGFLEFKEITSLAHVTETMLNQVRQGTLNLEGHIIDLLFDASEMMNGMLGLVREAVEGQTEVAPMAGFDTLVQKEQAVIDGKYEPPEQKIPDDITPDSRLGEVLTKRGVLNESDIREALAKQSESGQKLGEQLVSSGKVKAREVAKALREQQVAKGGTAKIRETVKVDLERVDNLLEMIGELVIVESMVVNAPELQNLTNLGLRNSLNQLGKITRDLQNVGMRMRMVPVRGVFQKMARMVRDLSRRNNKQIDFVQVGETTEMDRSMVEQISDPLVHMIRNSVDHGIEDKDERMATGKSPKGTVKLSAYHEGGNIIIEISDDGRGLDKDAILKKAITQGLIQESDNLSDNEIFNLIFAPGFSTAKKVTEISGRGVGMDVVKRNIESMRGRVIISSTRGEGTTFKIALPLTLAIIDGMLVSCGSERYIIPTLSIIESIKPEKSMLSSFADKWELLNMRGEVLPMLRLDRLFKIDDAKQDPTDALAVIVEVFGRKIGVLVDDVIAQQQVVIKNIGSGIKDIKFVSGAAIMADGRVGLIVNTEEIANLVASERISKAAIG